MRFKHRHLCFLVMGLMISSLLSGCAESSKDDEPQKPEQPTYEVGEPVEVSVSLSSRSMISSGTRSDGRPAEPDDPNEKIKDWFLVFVHRSGKVSKIVTRSATLKGTAVEQETFKCIIPTGTYSVYAFANITPAELQAASGVKFIEGNTLTEEAQNSIKKGVWKGLESSDGCKHAEDAPVSHGGIVIDAKADKVTNNNLNLWDIKKAIPMTGYLPEVKIQNKVEESFSIEVVRMLAKIDFKISNSTNKNIKVNGIGLDPVTVSPVSLFPNGASTAGISYGFLGNYAFTPPVAGAEYARLMYKPETPWTVNANTTLDKPCRFYFKESLSERDNGKLFTVWLDVTHADGDRSVVQYNVTSTIKEYINRNDWIVIPVDLSRYAVQVDALFYPPIGGYPAYLSSTNPDGSQVFTFGTQGEFCIVPHVIDKETGEHLSPSLYKFGIKEGSISDPDGIFKKTPTISETAPSLPDEILGTLNTNQGTAYLTIWVTVTDPETDQDRTYYRTIHIVRDNTAVPANNTTD